MKNSKPNRNKYNRQKITLINREKICYKMYRLKFLQIYKKFHNNNNNNNKFFLSLKKWITKLTNQNLFIPSKIQTKKIQKNKVQKIIQKFTLKLILNIRLKIIWQNINKSQKILMIYKTVTYLTTTVLQKKNKKSLLKNC